MTEQNTLLFYKNHWTQIESLSDDDLAKLLRAVFNTTFGGKQTDVEASLSPSALMAYRFIMLQISLDSEKYQETCRKRKAAADKRWNKQGNHANASFAMHDKDEDEDKDEVEDEDKDKDEVEDEDKDKDEVEDVDDAKDKDNSSAAAENKSDSAQVQEAAAAAEKVFLEKSRTMFMPWFNKLLEDNDSKIPKLKEMTPKRSRRIKEILNSYGQQKLVDCCRHAAQSSFLNGKGKNNKFVATFDWIIDEENFLKVLEGNYNV
ncbi:MAG: hypothetical protein IKX44_02050 [Prevotella sp.]|nr:hypothetical protein [Prevotella sp.]